MSIREIRVARSGGTAVGYVASYSEADTQMPGEFGPMLAQDRGRVVGVVRELHVPQRLRGRGLGTTLLRELLTKMGKAGAKAIYTHAVAFGGSSQSRLVAFYARHKFITLESSAFSAYMRRG